MYLWDHSASLIRKTLDERQSQIDGATFSRDGSRVMSWSDGSVRIWDDLSGDDLSGKARTVVKQTVPIIRAQFSPDESRIVVWSRDKTVRIWATGPLQPLTPPLLHESDLLMADFGPDPQSVTTWTPRGVARIWKVEASGSRVALPMLQTTGVKRAGFIQDTKQVVAVTNQGKVHLWDFAGKSLRELRLGEFEGGPVISRSGRTILTWQDTDLRIWNVEQPDVPVLLQQKDSVKQARFGQRDRWILTWSDGRIVRLWDSANGRVAVDLAQAESSILGAVMGPDDEEFCVWTDTGSAHVWESRGNDLLSCEQIHRSKTRCLAPMGNDYSSGGAAERWKNGTIANPKSLGE